VLTLAADQRLRTFSHIDERAAAFFAVGLARATGDPVVLACTSGTAAANYLPAVIEASEAGLPLIVLTADRPPELRDVGAGQAIDQIKLYGDAVRLFQEVDTVDASAARMHWIRGLACRAAAVSSGASGGRAGPVHLNFSLREPLVLDVPLSGDAGDGGREDRKPWVAAVRPPLAPGQLLAWLADQKTHGRGVIVAGGSSTGGLQTTISDIADLIGWPLLADPLSGARSGQSAIAHYDLLLRNGTPPGLDQPTAVLRFGELPTSKPLRQWLAGLDCAQLVVADDGAWPDPAATAHTRLPMSHGMVWAALQRLQEQDVSPAGNGWREQWWAADRHAAAAIDEILADGLNEPNIARAVGTATPSGSTVVVASSMPIRDVEGYWPATGGQRRAIANRGANGIDGTISTAYGVSAAPTAAPTYLLIGDVAFAHDLSGLLAGTRLELNLTIVLVDNAGGGIFDFLPVGQAGGDMYEQHIATPPGIAFEHAARTYGAAYKPIGSLAELKLELATIPQGTTVLHVRTDRAENVRLHHEVAAAVATTSA